MAIDLYKGSCLRTASMTTTNLGGGNLTTGSFSVWIRFHEYFDKTPEGFIIFGVQATRPFYLVASVQETNKIGIGWHNGTTGISADFLIVKDFNYHVASTFEDGIQKYYINGYLVDTDALAGPNLANPDVRVMGIGDYRTTQTLNQVHMTVDDPVFWGNYVLTQQDVFDLRNKVKTPTQVSSNIVWGLTCDGTPGATVTLGSAGALNYGSDTAAPITQVVSNPTYGLPTYVADLTYTPLVQYEYSHVGPSGKTIIFSFADIAGTDSDVTDIFSHPTIKINGGEAIQLANPIWGISKGNRSLPYVIYAIEQTIADTDVVTCTMPEGWVYTTAGVPGGLTDFQLTNFVGRNILPEFAKNKKVMKLGWNTPGCNYYSTFATYKNLAKHSSRWLPDGAFTLGANGYPASFNEGTDSLTAIVYRTDAGSTYPGAVPGFYTLMWDGSDMVALESATTQTTTVTERSRRITGTTDNVITYEMTRDYDLIYTGLQVRIYGTNISNIRVYPPNHIPNDLNDDIFFKDYLRITKERYGLHALRVMDFFGTNAQPNTTSISDLKSGNEFTYFTPKEIVFKDVASVEPWDNTGFFNTGRLYLKVNTVAPHGFVTGQTVGFTGCGSINLSDATTLNINNFFGYTVYVLSPTSFATSAFTATPGVTVTELQEVGGKAQLNISQQDIPLLDVVKLVNKLDCGIWFCVPHLWNDELIEYTAELIADNLQAGKHCYIEYSNECWNYSAAYIQTRYCYGMGNTDAEIVAMEPNVFYRGYRYYAKRSIQIHDIFKTVFAAKGRSADLTTVCGGQLSNTAVADVILQHITYMTKTVDAIAIAPYYSNGPEEPSFGAIYDTLNLAQLMDLTEMFVSKGEYLVWIEEQMHELPEGVQLYCYEGGPEAGVPYYDAKHIGTNNVAARSRSWGRDPRQAHITNYMMQKANDIGVTLWMFFSLHGNNGTIDGNYRFSSNWNCYFRWDQVASVGDGSDGLFDNRTNYEDVYQVNSTIGYAVIRWMEVNPGRKGTMVLNTAGGKFIVNTDF